MKVRILSLFAGLTCSAFAINNWDTNIIHYDPTIPDYDQYHIPELQISGVSVNSLWAYNPTTHHVEPLNPSADFNVDFGAKTIGITFPSASRSYAYPTRTLNSGYQISTTRDAAVSYTVDIAATLSLTSGQAGSVVLEYADDSGFTTNVKTVCQTVNGNTGTLTIGLNLTQTASGTLSGIIPANKYVRIRTVNTTGSPSFTYRGSQEVLL